MLNALNAILFDLDGTLLDANMNVFLPHYFELLTAFVAHLVPPHRFMPCLMQATDIMVANNGPETNADVFAQRFYPCAQVDRAQLEPVFMAFYTEEFPKLRRYTRLKPAARQVVQAALGLGCDLVVATNPLFPAVAIQQRLEWAGVADFPYRLVTSYENSHATKPNPLYFQEILSTINQPAEKCLMVGDEDMDMAAAHLGCPTFLVPGPRTELDAGTPEPTYRGTLADLLALLEAAR
jgi:HAD superfamily hydrolase (TIGR01549 family)